MNASRTPLQQLMSADGSLDQSAIAAASDDLLRQATRQAIDALERMSDVADLVQNLSDNWGLAPAKLARFDEMLENQRATAPVDEGFSDTGYSVSINGHTLVSEADRASLVEILGQLHLTITRYERTSRLLLESASAACRGEYVQSEFDKADHRQELASSPSPATKGPRP